MEKQPDPKKTQTRSAQEADASPKSSSKRRRDRSRRRRGTIPSHAVDIGYVIFSPSGRAYTFDDLCATMNMICMPWISNSDPIEDFGDFDDPVLDELNRTYACVLEQMEREKERGKQLMMQKHSHPLYGKPIDDMNLEELQTLKADLVDLKEKVIQQTELLASQSSGSNSGIGH